MKQQAGASAILLVIVLSVAVSVSIVLIEWMQSVQHERRMGRTEHEEIDSGPPARGHQIGSYTLTF